MTVSTIHILGRILPRDIRVHRQAKFAQSTILRFQYLGFHDHTFNRAKTENYVISPRFHGQACHGQATEFSCPGYHDKQQNSLTMHCSGTEFRILVKKAQYQVNQ